VSFFLLLAHGRGAVVPEEVRRPYDRLPRYRGYTARWVHAGSASVLIAGGDSLAAPRIARVGPLLGVGVARLDNPQEVRRWIGQYRPCVSDLELIVADLACNGYGRIGSYLGDFAFAVWDAVALTLTVARDAFGVKRVFHARPRSARSGHPDARLLAAASRADLLALDERYDLAFLLELAALRAPTPGRSAFAGVDAVQPGTVVTLNDARTSTRQFWAAAEFQPDERARPIRSRAASELCNEFRERFLDGIRARLTGEPDVWSQLSGGLDSSSVVCGAQWLARTDAVAYGVSGTVSWLYRWSTDGDERHFSSIITKHTGVRNELVQDFWSWRPEDGLPPVTDEPNPEHLLHGRERRTRELVEAAGGRVLLTGFGSDHYLLGNMFFFADWIAQGRVRDAMREMLRRAAIGRVSFWNLAYRNALLPLLPATLRRRLVPGASLPPWIRRSAAESAHIVGTSADDSYAGPRGLKYAALVQEQMRSIPLGLRRHDLLEGLDVRHPFLYRPLVELGLRLPPEMCVQPHARKWILREAMRGILPEPVRTRVGKGGNLGFVHQALIRERPTIARILDDPLLAQLGCIDPVRLRAGIDEACRTGAEELVSAAIYTLAVETWLHVRSGRPVTETRREQGNSDLHHQQGTHLTGRFDAATGRTV